MINYLSKPFKWFFKLEAASGLVLLFAAIIALIISNSELSELYFSTLNKYLFIGINNFGLKLSVIHWINDALMAIFFFFVTLEIKREFLQGELSNIKQALLPIIAAVGGMLVPALIYVYINLGDSATLNGWAIPSATDIAFSLGILSLLGSRVPISLKVFLTALAIIDDLGAILIIISFIVVGHSLSQGIFSQFLLLIHIICISFWLGSFLPLRYMCTIKNFTNLYFIADNFGRYDQACREIVGGTYPDRDARRCVPMAPSRHRKILTRHSRRSGTRVGCRNLRRRAAHRIYGRGLLSLWFPLAEQSKLRSRPRWGVAAANGQRRPRSP